MSDRVEFWAEEVRDREQWANEMALFAREQGCDNKTSDRVTRLYREHAEMARRVLAAMSGTTPGV